MSVAKTIIRRLMGVYGEPKTPEPDVFLTEFEAALAGYDEDALQEAVTLTIRRSTFWPKPAELLDATREILAAREKRILDLDARENERKAGWRFADVKKAKFMQDPEWQKERDTLMANFKAFMSKVDGEEEKKKGLETDWKRGQRDGFEEMQRTSPNKGLHRK